MISTMRNTAMKMIRTTTSSSVLPMAFNKRFMASALLTKFEASVEQLPMREAVKYTSIKNGKWTATELKTKVDAHANGLLDIGINSGDTIGIWMDECPERHVSLLACAKAGLKVADIDTSICTVPAIREALALAKCNAIIFHPVTEKMNSLLLLRKAIPELYYYEDEYGQFFHSKHFPELKFFIQTGFDKECGCLNYKYVKLPNPVNSMCDVTMAATKDDTPLYFKITGSGEKATAGALMTHGAVAKEGTWPFFDKLTKNEYFEV